MKFLATFLAACAAWAVVYALPATLIDARLTFGTGLVPSLRIDTRGIKLRTLSSYDASAPVDGIVLGSSQAELLQPAWLDAHMGGRFFNLAVNNARVEDYLALYQWTRSKGIRPRTVIISLDVASLHNNDAPSPDFYRNRALNHDLTWLKLVRLWITDYRPLFTWNYLQDMLRVARIDLADALAIRRAVPLQSFDADGYLRYPLYRAQMLNHSFSLERNMQVCLGSQLSLLQDMTAVSPKRSALLERLVHSAQADGARVVLWITPLHPRLIQLLEQRTRYDTVLRETRTLVATLGSRYGIETHDFSELERFGGTTTGWYDCNHLDESNVALVEAGLIE